MLLIFLEVEEAGRCYVTTPHLPLGCGDTRYTRDVSTLEKVHGYRSWPSLVACTRFLQSPTRRRVSSNVFNIANMSLVSVTNILDVPVNRIDEMESTAVQNHGNGHATEARSFSHGLVS